MTDISLSRNQVADAAGVYADTMYAEVGTAPYIPNESQVPCPGYEVAAASLGADTYAPSFSVAPNDWRLANLGGLRVQVGVQTSDRRQVFLPGIVLPDSGNGVRIGCLSGPDMIRDVNAGLTDPQQALLEQMAAMHMPGVGEHAASQQVNVGDIGHAALIAITAPTAVSGIHGQVHDFVGAGLSQAVSRTGALTISSRHGSHSVNEVIVPASQAADIVVPRHYQLPSSLNLRASDAAIGITLAAVRSQGDNYPQPDLARNAVAVVTQGA